MQKGIGLGDFRNFNLINLATVVQKPHIRIVWIDLNVIVTAVACWFAASTARVAAAFGTSTHILII